MNCWDLMTDEMNPAYGSIILIPLENGEPSLLRAMERQVALLEVRKGELIDL